MLSERRAYRLKRLRVPYAEFAYVGLGPTVQGEEFHADNSP